MVKSPRGQATLVLFPVINKLTSNPLWWTARHAVHTSGALARAARIVT
jgi:hypothetical protein